jgi:predicted SAM-dependent methyltransferase
MHAITNSHIVDTDAIRGQLLTALATPDITHGLARTLRACLKELDLYDNHEQARAAAPPSTPPRHPRVQIGGGNHRLPGFHNIDIIEPADQIWDVRESLPLPSGSVEFLFSEHFLEHIDYPRSAKTYAGEAHRVLATGGHIVTGVPDAEAVLTAYQHRDPAFFADMRERWYSRRDCLADLNTYIDLVNYVFRDQDDSDRYTPHLWAYDHEKLVDLFTEAGFTHVERWTFDDTIANPKRRWGSVYVIATK